MISLGNLTSQADANWLISQINQCTDLCDDFEQANQSFHEIEKQFTSQQGLDSLWAVFYHKWGVCAYWHYEFDLAVDRYQQALNIRQKIFDAPHRDLARSNLNIGIAKKYLEEYVSAKRYLELALNQWRQLGEEDLVAQSHFEIGWTLQDAGDLDGAILHQDQALEIYQKLYGRVDYDVAFTKELRAITYDLLGDHQKASAELIEVVEIYEELEYAIETANALHNLGNSYDRMGDRKKALEVLSRSLEVNRQMGSERIEALADDYSDIGQVYHNMGELGNARLYMDSAQTLWSALYPAKHPSRAAGFDNLGNLFESVGDSKGAIALYDSALIQLLPDSVHLLSTDISFFDVEQKPELFTILHDKTISLRSLVEKENQDEYVKPLTETYDLITELVNYMQSRFSSENTKLHWIEIAREIYGEAIAFCYGRAQISDHSDWTKRALSYMEASKALILYQQFAESQIDQNSALGKDLSLARKMERRIVYWTKKNFEDVADKTATIDSLLHWRNVKESLLDRMKEQYVAYAQLLSDTGENPLQAFQSGLPKNSICLSYQETVDHFYCITMTHDALDFFELEGDDEIQTELKRTKAAISSIQSDPQIPESFNLNSTLETLYEKLMHPILKESIGAFSHFIILPDGELHGLPFETLRKTTGEGFDYIVRDVACSYHYSLNLYEKSRIRKKINWKQAKLTVIAPDYAGSDLPPLEGVKAEIEQLKSSYPTCNAIRIQNSFSKVLSPENLSSDIVHFAMHGFTRDSDRFGAYLAFPEGRDSIWKLYNWQISALPLQTQLVVLSACETGAGLREAGEGIYSLGRGFFSAGVPRLIMANWKSNDASTAVIIGSFYKNLSQNVSPPSALQIAKVAYIDDPIDEIAHPYFWAHLNYTGEVAGKPKSYWPLVWLSLVIVVGGLFWLFWRRRGNG